MYDLCLQKKHLYIARILNQKSKKEVIDKNEKRKEKKLFWLNELNYLHNSKFFFFQLSFKNSIRLNLLRTRILLKLVFFNLNIPSFFFRELITNDINKFLH